LKDFAAILSKLSRFGKQTFKGQHSGAERQAGIGDPIEQMDGDGCLSFISSHDASCAIVLPRRAPLWLTVPESGSTFRLAGHLDSSSYVGC
jgi:hypothetical protein